MKHVKNSYLSSQEVPSSLDGGQAVLNVEAPRCQLQGNSTVEQGVNFDVYQRAFKGKGRLRDLRHWSDRLARIEAEMVKLGQESRLIAAQVGAYLALHRRTATGLVQLRWRERGGAKRHLLGQDVQAQVADRGAPLQRAVGSLAERAEALNALHAQAREMMREVGAAVVKRRVPLLIRRIA